jgi:hypothetical protein
VAYPQVVDGGDDLRILKVIAEVLIKQSSTSTEKECLFSFGVGREDDNVYHKNTQHLELDVTDACTVHGSYTNACKVLISDLEWKR